MACAYYIAVPRPAHPDIDLVLGTDGSTVDGPDSEGVETDLLQLRDGDIDVEVRFGRGGYPGMRTDHVMDVAYVPICHPDLLKGIRPIRTAADLRFHTLLHDETAKGRSERVSWADWLRAAQVEGVDASRGLHFSNSILALEAAMDGLGVGLGLGAGVERVDWRHPVVRRHHTTTTGGAEFLVQDLARDPLTDRQAL